MADGLVLTREFLDTLSKAELIAIILSQEKRIAAPGDGFAEFIQASVVGWS
jgi:hypothetical protein